MSLVEDRPEGVARIRWVRAEAIGIGDREFGRSLLVAPDRVLEDWAPRALDQIDDAAVAQVLELAPELVLLGTGTSQRMPPPALMAAFLRRGIGLEAMDNAAAARTFNLLVAEGRRAVAAFLLPG